MDKQVHTPTGNVDRPPGRDERQGSRALERDVNRDRKMEQKVDEAGEESFPASDPPAWTSGSVVVRGHEERAPGVSVEETVEPANLTDESRAAGEAQPGRSGRADQARARGRNRGKAKQRAAQRTDRPKTDDEDTLDMSRDKDRVGQADREQQSASDPQRGAIPQKRDEDRNERHEAVQMSERKQPQRTHLAPERTDDRTDLPGRRSASEGPHEVFPGEPRSTPPKPIVH